MHDFGEFMREHQQQTRTTTRTSVRRACAAQCRDYVRVEARVEASNYRMAGDLTQTATFLVYYFFFIFSFFLRRPFPEGSYNSSSSSSSSSTAVSCLSSVLSCKMCLMFSGNVATNTFSFALLVRTSTRIIYTHSSWTIRNDLPVLVR